MAINEKKYNGYLFDQLEIVEEALTLAKNEKATETIAYLERKKSYINRKLYDILPPED